MSNQTSMLYGAIIGDISGSPYEGGGHGQPIKSKEFKFIRHRGHFTDDTVMTIAVADALLNCYAFEEYCLKIAFTESMQRWGRKYPRAGYGHGFKNWLKSDDPHPYKSFGNGSAMRVSAISLIGKLFNDMEFVRNVARWSAEVTHNHLEGVKAAESVASAIFLAQRGKSKDEIKSYVESEFGYNLSRTLDEIRPTYDFEVAAQTSVPEAIIAFLEAENFEDAIRNAVSLGGDADTQAAIAGSIAEAFFGVPDEFKSKIRKKLPREMLAVLDECNKIFAAQDGCPELAGNERIDAALRSLTFPENESDTDWKRFDDELLRQMNDESRCFIVALKKVYEDDDTTNYTPLILTDKSGESFMAVFTNFYEFNKALRARGKRFKCVTNQIKSLFQNIIDINAATNSRLGLVINPFGASRISFSAAGVADLLS